MEVAVAKIESRFFLFEKILSILTHMDKRRECLKETDSGVYLLRVDVGGDKSSDYIYLLRLESLKRETL